MYLKVFFELNSSFFDFGLAVEGEDALAGEGGEVAVGFFEGNVEFVEFSVSFFERPFVDASFEDFDAVESDRLFAVWDFFCFGDCDLGDEMRFRKGLLGKRSPP